MTEEERIAEVELYAWIGEDEFGSGQIGLKQGVVPAGVIPIVAVNQEKIDRFWEQAEHQAVHYGKRIYLCRFKMVEVIKHTRGDS